MRGAPRAQARCRVVAFAWAGLPVALLKIAPSNLLFFEGLSHPAQAVLIVSDEKRLDAGVLAAAPPYISRFLTPSSCRTFTTTCHSSH